jgi:hypothetical protein
VNSKKSLFLRKTGIVFSDGVAPTQGAEIDIGRMGTMARTNQWRC